MEKKERLVPQSKHEKTRYPGVTFIVSNKYAPKEKIYYINYRDPSGKRRFESVGGSIRHKMTDTVANHIRTDRIGGRETPNVERREAKAEREAEQTSSAPMTFNMLWDTYEELNEHKAGLYRDSTRYDKHLREYFGDMQPQ
ncbi:MAG: hypothetical protein WBB46_06720, partial [Candidatus Deferrimicrobiaceae bacterium]